MCPARNALERSCLPTKTLSLPPFSFDKSQGAYKKPGRYLIIYTLHSRFISRPFHVLEALLLMSLFGNVLFPHDRMP